MTLRVHWAVVCNGGYTKQCVRSPKCEGYLALEDGRRDVRGAVREAGWAWVADVRGDVQLCRACLAANRPRYEVIQHRGTEDTENGDGD